MTTSEFNETLDANKILAERVRQQLQVFPEKFRELGEGGELSNLLRTTQTLHRPRIEQEPEFFTEQYLIEPVLHALGYFNPISDDYEGTGPHFVRRPTTFRKLENKRPDFLIKNISSETVCILEAKAANNEQCPPSAKREATEDIKDYVESNTFAKYLKTQDQQYLIAIGSDGLRWTLWAKDLLSDKVKRDLKVVDLSEAIEAEAQRDSVIEGEPEYDTARVREYLTKEFIPAFSARNIKEFPKSGIE